MALQFRFAVHAGWSRVPIFGSLGRNLRHEQTSTLFPVRGQIWEVTDGCDAQIQYLFTAPITFSGSGRLTAGERVRIMTGTTEPQPTRCEFSASSL